MANYTFTDEDIKIVEKLIDIKNHGYYCDAAQLTNVYNRILHRGVMPTNCGSCMRARIQELENALNSFKAKIALESVPRPKLDDTPQEENKAVVASGNDIIEDSVEETKPKKKNKK